MPHKVPIIIESQVWQDLMSSLFWREAIWPELRQLVADGHKIFFRDEVGTLAEINYATIQ